MARIRQQYPQNYGSSGNIHTEFENLVRYLNAGELGDKTIPELLATLFDEDGEFDGPIEFRLNSTAGLQYRIGEYREAEDGWITITDIASIRGPAGQNLGLIEGPLFFNRQDIIPSVNGTTVFSYVFDDDVEDIVVYKNGVLLRVQGVSPQYTFSASLDTVTLASGANTTDTITIYSIRAGAVSNYRRLDFVATGTTAVVAFPHDSTEKILVYKNGILQREGGSYDYVLSSDQGTVTFVSPLINTDTASILTVENQAQTNLAGLMLEDDYTDANGFILFEKISIDDGDIPQAKVSGLVSTLTSKAKITIAASTPSSPASGDLWLDTSQTPNVLKFYQGTQWLSASPENGLPSFVTGDANKVLMVNGTGTQYVLGDVDDSHLVPKTYMGAANGVASLDSDGKLPTSQLPEIFSVDTLGFANFLEDTSTTVTNKTYYIRTFYKQKVRIDGISALMASGTCTIQLAVDGVAVGTTYAVSTTRINQNISPVIEIDATTVGKTLQIITTSVASTPASLTAGISIATLNT